MPVGVHVQIVAGVVLGNFASLDFVISVLFFVVEVLRMTLR